MEATNAIVDGTVRVRDIEASNVAELIRIGEKEKLSPWSAECYFAELKNPDSIMLRLVSDLNRSIGFIVGRIVMSASEGLDAEIYNIAVTGNEQGKGYGQILFDAFSDRCRERAVDTIWLEVRQSNQTAISFYERNGFRAVQKRNHFYENPREHGWLMRADLKKNVA